MKHGRSRFGEIVIEITPLVDVIFLLLLFFILTTTFTVKERSIDVELPKAVSGGENPRSDLVVIVIDSKDNIVINGEKIGMDDLKEILEKLRNERHFSKALIKADEHSHHGVVVRVMDSLRLLGVHDIRLAVKEK